jgi:hypothetical protein
MSFLVTVQVRDNMTRILFAELYVTKLEIDKHVPTRVSNGTIFSCPAGQRDRRPLIAPGQRRQRDKDFFLSRDKGTTGQAQNLATGRAGIF